MIEIGDVKADVKKCRQTFCACTSLIFVPSRASFRNEEGLGLVGLVTDKTTYVSDKLVYFERILWGTSTFKNGEVLYRPSGYRAFLVELNNLEEDIISYKNCELLLELGLNNRFMHRFKDLLAECAEK